MRSVNKVFLYGNLGADPESRTTPSGKLVTTFSLATHRSVRADEGFKEETDWHKVVAFDWMAKRASDRLRRGHPVAVVGSIRPRTWKDQEGKSRKNVEIRAENLCFSPLPIQDEKSTSASTRSPSLSAPEAGNLDRAVDPPSAQASALPETATVPF